MTREERENALHCLRAMVEEEVCEECELYGTTGTDHCEADCVRVAIEALKQEPRKGHWIYDYTSADGHRTYHCSECGCYLQPKHSEPLNSFKWCSLCGADMREVQE